MRDWQIGFSKDGPVYIIEEGPWWAFFLEWLSESGPLSCGHIPRIPFPNIGKIKDIDEETGEIRGVHTWKEWHGTLQDWWHVYIDSPLTQIWFKHMTHVPSIDLSVELLKEAHPKDYKRWLEHRKEMDEDDE